jgi:lipoprotein NlpI
LISTKKVEAATTEAEKYPLQQKVVATYEELLQEGEGYEAYAASAYGNLSWYALFAEDFAAAEQAARSGLALDETATWIHTNLASALLFQGRYKETKVIYDRFRNVPSENEPSKTYRKIFLEDLEALEAAGITHKDVKKARKLLE